MDTHGVKVFDGADNNAVIVAVPDHFHLILFPANQRLINQQLIGWRQIQTATADLFKFFPVVGDTTTGATHGKRGADNAGETKAVGNLRRFFHAVGNTRVGGFQTNGFHRLVETLAIFRLVDSIGIGTDHLNTVLLENAMLGQVQGTVQCGLTTHGWQQCIGLFLGNNMLNRAPLYRFDIGRIRHRRVGHNRRRVGVDQNNPEALFAKCFTGLGPGIVKLTGLADYNRACAEDKDAFNISSFWHFVSISALLAARSHKFDKVVKQHCCFMGARAGLGVTLETKGWFICTVDTLQGAIEQGTVGGDQVSWQALLIDREAVVLAGDHHYIVFDIFNRVVGTVVAKLHLGRFGTGCQGQ